MTAARTPRYDARRAEVVALARDVLVEVGLEKFALRDIAARAEMTLGNLQYYYPTRADLLEAVARSDLDRDLASFDAPRGSDPVTRLGRSARQLLRNWSESGSSIWLTVAALASHDDRFRALSAEVYERFYATLGASIEEIATGASDAEISQRARLITAVLDGVGLQRHSALATKPQHRADLERRAISLVQQIARAG